MKRLFIMLCAFSLVLSCTDGKQGPDDEIPPHLQGTTGQDKTDGKEDDGSQGGSEGGEGGEGGEGISGTGEPVTLRFVSYNVGAFNKFYTDLGHYSYPEVASVLKSVEADAVGLNETYKGKSSVDDGAFQAAKLAAEMGTGWTSYFAYAANTAYGNSIIASPDFKVVKEWPRVMIEKIAGAGEIRSLGAVEYEDFVFCVTHLDHLSNEARKNGVAVITEWAQENYGTGKTSKPVILLGDMNCLPAESPISEFKKNWTLVSANEPTFPSKNTCIDFIFVLDNGVEVTPGESHSIRLGETVAKASDHYPIYVDLTFKKQK